MPQQLVATPVCCMAACTAATHQVPEAVAAPTSAAHHVPLPGGNGGSHAQLSIRHLWQPGQHGVQLLLLSGECLGEPDGSALGASHSRSKDVPLLAADDTVPGAFHHLQGRSAQPGMAAHSFS